MPGEPAFEVRLDSLLEHRTVEGFRSPPEGLRLETPGVPLEITDGKDQIIDGLLFEEHARGGLGAASRCDGLEGATPAQGDHRPPRGHRLEGRDAEVLDRGKQECATAGVQVGDLGIVAPPEELDMRAGERPEATFLGAGPDTAELPFE